MESDTETPPGFGSGSLVRLRSGGPAMTVLGDSRQRKPFVICCWFWRGKYYEEEFYAYALTADLNAPIPALDAEASGNAKPAAARQPASAEN